MHSKELAFFLASTLALATSYASTPTNHVLAPDARVVDGGREVQISSAQAEIQTNINTSNVARATGGGALMALIDAGVEQHRATVAEAAIRPLRDALIGYDFDARVQEATKNTLTSLDWFGATEYGFAQEVTMVTRQHKLDATARNQIVFVDYAYAVSLDFNAIEVSVRFLLVDKPMPGQKAKSVTRVSDLAYQQWHEVLVPLRDASDDKDANTRRWAADGGALAKLALESGLAQLQTMIKRGLTQSPDDARRNTKGAKVVAGGYAGLLIEKSDAYTMLWNQKRDQWMLVTNPIG